MRQPSDYKFVTTVLRGGIETRVVHMYITNPSSLHAIIKKNTQEIILVGLLLFGGSELV
jgi:hypothetical protein